MGNFPGVRCTLPEAGVRTGIKTLETSLRITSSAAKNYRKHPSAPEVLPGDMAACLAGVAGLGVGSSLLQSSLTGLAGVLPAYVIGATMAGQGVAGVRALEAVGIPETSV